MSVHSNHTHDICSEISHRVQQVVQNKLKSTLSEKLALKGDSTVDNNNDNDDKHHPDTKKQKKQLRRLLGQTQHCFTTLLQKQESLRTGLEILKKETWPALWKEMEQCLLLLSTASKTHTTSHQPPPVAQTVEDSLTVLLHHLFLNLLRLHDGFILLASGECRHAGDVAEARRTRYPSRLTESTGVYHAHLTYSGASWDEWNDPQNGIATQWKRFLKSSKLWNKIVSPAVDGLVDTLDTSSIQQEFLEFVNRQVVPALKTRFARVKLSLQDKLEELRLCFDSKTWQLQRRGKKFQIQDPQGVLPLTVPVTAAVANSSHSNLGEMWRKLLALPSSASGSATHGATKTKANKKRKVIVDSDEEEENANPDLEVKQAAKRSSSGPPNTCGLTLTVKEQKSPSHSSSSATTLQTPSKGDTISLNAIKQKLGVNASDLSQAHETLKAEIMQPATPPPRQEDDIQQQEELQKEQVQERIRSCKRNLRSMQLSQEDENHHLQESGNRVEQLWEAQERLRRAFLNAGNVFLNLQSQQGQNKKQRVGELKQALRFFMDSARQVQAQKSLNKIMSQNASRHRELFLFECRADLNCGITRVELWREGIGTLKDAIHFFQLSKDRAKKMREMAIAHRTEVEYKNQEEALYAVCDEIEALKLQTMTFRWLAVALWNQRRFQDSVEEFHVAASLVDVLSSESIQHWIRQNPDLQEPELDFRAECYHSYVMAVDMASGELEKVSANSLQADEGQAAWVFETAKQFLSQASLASRAIEMRLQSDQLDEFFTTKGIRSSQELLAARDEIVKWWEGKREALLRSLSNVCVNDQESIPDSFPVDSFGGSSTELDNSFPAEIFNLALGPASRRKRTQTFLPNSNRIRQYNETSEDAVNDSTRSQTRGGPDASTQRKYRRWGDELLPQSQDPITGISKPVLLYPCVPPPMPPEIASIWSSSRPKK